MNDKPKLYPTPAGKYGEDEDLALNPADVSIYRTLQGSIQTFNAQQG